MCRPALVGLSGGTTVPGPFLELSYSLPPRMAALLVPGVLDSLGVCLLKERSTWGDRAERQAPLSALSSLPGVSGPQKFRVPSCHSLGPAEPSCTSSGEHLATCSLVGCPVPRTRAPKRIRSPLGLVVSVSRLGLPGRQQSLGTGIVGSRIPLWG